jgi:hypothetical protein
LAMQASVAAKPTRYLSGPRLDPHWEFGQTAVKPVRVMLQVSSHNTAPDQQRAQRGLRCHSCDRPGPGLGVVWPAYYCDS